MRDLFKGWRRKAGVVVLVMACGLVGMWARSFHTEDMYVYPIEPYVTDLLFSSGGCVGWRRDDEAVWDIPRDHRDYGFQSRRWDRQRFAWSSEVFNWRWDWRWCGLGHAVGHEAETWVLPYWMLVLPLTLLSAILLFWPLRKRPRPIQT